MKDGNFKTSLKSSNIIIVSVIVIFCALLAVNTIQIRKYNEKSLELSKAHIKYTDIAMQLNLGSDILTEQVRLFAETGDIEYMDAYFEEAKDSGHRDIAMQELDDLPWVHNEENVRRAMRESNKLMEREYYAMRLTAMGYGIPEDSLPEEIKAVKLSPEDIAISSIEAKQKARALLFDDTYLSAKHRIKSYVNTFLDNIIDISLYEYDNITAKLRTNIILQTVIIFFMLVAIIAITLMMNKFIIRPIIRAAKNIKNNKPIEMPQFLEEMQSLDESYNGLRAHNNELMGRLSIMANEDALTGVGSRFAYNRFIDGISEKHEPVIMFLFDLNNLRSTNNTEGHASGDKLLIDATKCIKNVFGIYEYENCFRVGGDEFVAFIEKEPRKRANVYIDEFKKETEKSGVSVSVGYSFAEDIGKASINAMFNDADINMYREKYGKINN